jgi:hypothetical protein
VAGNIVVEVISVPVDGAVVVVVKVVLVLHCLPL